MCSKRIGVKDLSPRFVAISLPILRPAIHRRGGPPVTPRPPGDAASGLFTLLNALQQNITVPHLWGLENSLRTNGDPITETTLGGGPEDLWPHSFGGEKAKQATNKGGCNHCALRPRLLDNTT